MAHTQEQPRSLARRLGWFAGLWAAAVAVVAAVAWMIRLALGL